MAERYSGKVALITGASSGIGKAAASAFAQAGYATAIADRNEMAGQKIAEELHSEAAPCIFIRCDIAEEAGVRNLIARIKSAFGHLDAAFNNAGIEGDQGDTAECSTENWDRVIAVNLRGTWLCMKYEIEQMLGQEDGGSIVNCASVAGIVAMADIPAYVASKHGVVGLTKAAALEFATRKIRVNAVCPGAIETPMLERFMRGSNDAREMLVASEPIGRTGKPAEIASAALWLCSPGASFVTGHALAVDGGWTAQ